MTPDQLMMQRPPVDDQTWNCWLCAHVPPGPACESCPLLEDQYCQLFEAKTRGKKLKVCTEKLRK